MAQIRPRTLANINYDGMDGPYHQPRDAKVCGVISKVPFCGRSPAISCQLRLLLLAGQPLVLLAFNRV